MVARTGEVRVERLVEHLDRDEGAIDDLLRHVEGGHLGAREVDAAHDLGHVGVDG